MSATWLQARRLLECCIYYYLCICADTCRVQKRISSQLLLTCAELRSTCRNSFQVHFAHLLRASEEYGYATIVLLLPAGTVTGDSSLPHEAMAFLLPVAKAYLQQLSMPAVHALHAGRVQQLPQHDSPAAAASRPAALGTDDDHAASTTELDAVRACFAREMVQYMTAKVKAPQGRKLSLP